MRREQHISPGGRCRQISRKTINKSKESRGALSAASHQMVDVAGLAGVWPERKRIESLALAELVEHEQVGVHVVGVVGVGGVVLAVPLPGGRRVLGGAPLGLGLVVDHVEGDHLPRFKNNAKLKFEYRRGIPIF